MIDLTKLKNMIEGNVLSRDKKYVTKIVREVLPDIFTIKDNTIFLKNKSISTNGFLVDKFSHQTELWRNSSKTLEIIYVDLKEDNNTSHDSTHLELIFNRYYYKDNRKYRGRLILNKNVDTLCDVSCINFYNNGIDIIVNKGTHYDSKVYDKEVIIRRHTINTIIND